MKIFKKSLLSVAAVALLVTANPVYAKTPANMLVIANRIDDITTLDPAQSFEFAGSDLSRNVYGKLINFDALLVAQIIGNHFPDRTSGRF